MKKVAEVSHDEAKIFASLWETSASRELVYNQHAPWNLFKVQVRFTCCHRTTANTPDFKQN